MATEVDQLHQRIPEEVVRVIQRAPLLLQVSRYNINIIIYIYVYIFKGRSRHFEKYSSSVCENEVNKVIKPACRCHELVK